jgi:hypothetical protein
LFCQDAFITKDDSKFGGACVVHQPAVNRFRVLHRRVSQGADDYQLYRDEHGSLYCASPSLMSVVPAFYIDELFKDGGGNPEPTEEDCESSGEEEDEDDGMSLSLAAEQQQEVTEKRLFDALARVAELESEMASASKKQRLEDALVPPVGAATGEGQTVIPDLLAAGSVSQPELPPGNAAAKDPNPVEQGGTDGASMRSGGSLSEPPEKQKEETQNEEKPKEETPKDEKPEEEQPNTAQPPPKQEEIPKEEKPKGKQVKGKEKKAEEKKAEEKQQRRKNEEKKRGDVPCIVAGCEFERERGREGRSHEEDVPAQGATGDPCAGKDIALE